MIEIRSLNRIKRFNCFLFDEVKCVSLYYKFSLMLNFLKPSASYCIFSVKFEERFCRVKIFFYQHCFVVPIEWENQICKVLVHTNKMTGVYITYGYSEHMSVVYACLFVFVCVCVKS